MRTQTHQFSLTYCFLMLCSLKSFVNPIFPFPVTMIMPRFNNNNNAIKTILAFSVCNMIFLFPFLHFYVLIAIKLGRFQNIRFTPLKQQELEFLYMTQGRKVENFPPYVKTKWNSHTKCWRKHARRWICWCYTPALIVLSTHPPPSTQ